MPTLYMDDADFSEDEIPGDPGQPQDGGNNKDTPNNDGRPEDQQPASATAASTRVSRPPVAPASGTFLPGAAEAAHLAKARARLAAANAAAQAVGKDTGDEGKEATGQKAPKAKAKAKGRPKGSKGERAKSSRQTDGDVEHGKVKCFAGRTPPRGKEKLEEFVHLQQGYQDLRASHPSAQAREYFKFFHTEKVNFPDMPQTERVKRINEVWKQQHGQDGRAAKRKAKQSAKKTKRVAVAKPEPASKASRIENILQAKRRAQEEAKGKSKKTATGGKRKRLESHKEAEGCEEEEDEEEQQEEDEEEEEEEEEEE